MTFQLSPQAHDAPEGRKLPHRLGSLREKLPLLMGRAYEGDGTRRLALTLGFEPVVPPPGIRPHPWVRDRRMCGRCREVGRLFRRLKRLHRILPRFGKLDVIVPGFVVFALAFDALP